MWKYSLPCLLVFLGKLNALLIGRVGVSSVGSAYIHVPLCKESLQCYIRHSLLHTFNRTII